MDNKLLRDTVRNINKSSHTNEEKLIQINDIVQNIKLTETTRKYIKFIVKKLHKKPKIKVIKENITSYGEALIESFLKKNKIEYIKEKTFEDLVNIHTNCNLRFDFYLPKLNTCIEFDGKQHFFYTKEFDGKDKSKVKYRQYLDDLKNIYCINKNINLLRINYKQYKKVESILNQYLLC